MHAVHNVDEGMTHTRPLIPDVPFQSGPTYRPPPKPIRSNVSRREESSQSSPSSENILWKILHFKKVLFQKLIKDQTIHSSKNHKN